MQTLLSLSNDLAAAVEHAARAVIAVPARPRLPSTGVLAAGLVVLHPSVSPSAVERPGRRNLPEGQFAPLTPRELEILGMMAEGMGNRAIEFHIAAILDKLSARSRTEAVAIGMRRAY